MGPTEESSSGEALRVSVQNAMHSSVNFPSVGRQHSLPGTCLTSGLTAAAAAGVWTNPGQKVLAKSSSCAPLGLERSWGPSKNCNTDDSGGNVRLPHKKTLLGLNGR